MLLCKKNVLKQKARPLPLVRAKEKGRTDDFPALLRFPPLVFSPPLVSLGEWLSILSCFYFYFLCCLFARDFVVIKFSTIYPPLLSTYLSTLPVCSLSALVPWLARVPHTCISLACVSYTCHGSIFSKESFWVSHFSRIQFELQQNSI
jgi:hypothetical protein